MVLFDSDCRINLLLVLVDAVEVGSASTVVVVLLILTRACGDASVPVFMVVPLITIRCCLMPVGEANEAIWSAFSAGGARLHGALRPLSCGLSCIIIRRSASSTSSNWVVGRFISEIRELTLTVRGDLASRLDLRSFDVAAVVVMALPVGLSLTVVTRIVMPMVVEVPGVGLTLMEEQRRAMTKNEIICSIPMVWSLACLRHGVPIVWVPVFPRRGDGVVFFYYSLGVLMVI